MKNNRIKAILTRFILISFDNVEYFKIYMTNHNASRITEIFRIHLAPNHINNISRTHSITNTIRSESVSGLQFLSSWAECTCALSKSKRHPRYCQTRLGEMINVPERIVTVYIRLPGESLATSSIHIR